MKIVCAWCKALITEGSGQISHGCCAACAEKVERGSVLPVGTTTNDALRSQGYDPRYIRRLAGLKSERHWCVKETTPDPEHCPLCAREALVAARLAGGRDEEGR